jgi:hypothetical protein
MQPAASWNLFELHFVDLWTQWAPLYLRSTPLPLNSAHYLYLYPTEVERGGFMDTVGWIQRKRGGFMDTEGWIQR